MMLNLAKGEDFSVCVCVSGDLLIRPRFQFHASEFDRGGEREEREGPSPVMFPQGGRAKGGREKRGRSTGRKFIPTFANTTLLH